MYHLKKFNLNLNLLHCRNQFPNKWSALPEIGSAPEVQHDTALVPYTERSGYVDARRMLGSGEMRGRDHEGDVHHRLNSLEERLIESDKSNRALLQEVIRLQNDFKVSLSRYKNSLLCL